MLNAFQLARKLSCAAPTVSNWAKRLGLKPDSRGFHIDPDSEAAIAERVAQYRSRSYATAGKTIVRDDLFATVGPVLRPGDWATCPHCGARVVRRSLWPSARPEERHTC